MKIDYKKLIICLALPQLIGIIGSIFTFSSIGSWYNLLQKPSFAPPNYLFGPVWIILYFLMGIASYLLWTNNSIEAKKILKIYWVHLFFNGVWSIIFFGQQNIKCALFDIVVILNLLAWMINKSYKLDKRVFYLLLPYLGWVGFATILNYYLLILNK